MLPSMTVIAFAVRRTSIRAYFAAASRYFPSILISIVLQKSLSSTIELSVSITSAAATSCSAVAKSSLISLAIAFICRRHSSTEVLLFRFSVPMAHPIEDVGALVGGKVAYAAVVLIGAVNAWLTSKGKEPCREEMAATEVGAKLKDMETRGLKGGGITDPAVD